MSSHTPSTIPGLPLAVCSAFNVANALGGVIGGYAVDHTSTGAPMVPFLPAAVPLLGLALIVVAERHSQAQAHPSDES